MSGWLRVNPLFRQAQPAAPDEHTDEWERHLERASLFVKCMQQRNNTMRRLLEILVRQQQDFILHGDRFLKPMTRARIAGVLAVHESTISRAVAHKAVALPNGRIVPLQRFFDRSLSVRDMVKEIIHGEPRPLTDDEIVAELGRQGVAVARRTVAKYRAVEGILPARLRHRRQEVAAARI
jgi:RNA polymerase sigma-54 factor